MRLLSISSSKVFPLGALAIILWFSMMNHSVYGQSVPIRSHKQLYKLESGMLENVTPQTTVPFRKTVRVSKAPWLQLHFDNCNLGKQSYLTITSLKDGGQQRLDSRTILEWRNSTAIFNGDAVEVELHVELGDEGIFFSIEELTVGEPFNEQITSALTAPVEADTNRVIETLCGTTDDRVPSNDLRVGRLFGGGCTAWLVSNGAILTAGHCVDFDPDGSSPRLPNGVLDLAGVVEFNVPASDRFGNPVMANPNDQYPIDTTSVVWNFDGEGQGLGKDWAVFRVFPNSNTGLLPHQAQGAFFRMTREAPATGNNTSVTGYGVDDQLVRNFTQQTTTGPYQRETQSGTDFNHEYRTDTRGANSGSPIIWDNNGFTIGIHTNGGCGGTDTRPTGANAGTSFEHDPLENALQNFPGNNTVYVDRVSVAPAENGTIFQPYDTIVEAVNAVPAGGIISIVSGTYNEKIRIVKAARLTAPVGMVTIGR